MPPMSSSSTGLMKNNLMPARFSGSIHKLEMKLSSLQVFAYMIVELMMFHSCSPEPLYDDTKNIPASVWKTGEMIRFEVPVNDTNYIYKFYLNIRHSTDYRYANVFFFIHTTFPDGKVARDTVECILADKEGKWLGKGITNIRDNQVMLRRGLRFPQLGTYTFDFEQAMREPELTGIKDIGLRIIKE